MPEPENGKAVGEKKPRIAIGCDHAGFQMKESIREFLLAAGHAVDDLGTRSEESVDYPDYAAAVARSVAEGRDDLGILVCGTGIGMAIAANKVDGVRAALAHSATTAHMAREHNDANVLTLGARVVSRDEGLAIVREFLSAGFAGGRHQRRVEKIAALERPRQPNGE